MSNYIIVIDENGSPYIAHAAERSNHKYLRKVRDGSGWRYFYTEQEWNAYIKNRNKPKTQADIEKDRHESAMELNKASKDLKNTEELLSWSKKMRDQNSAYLKAYEDAYKEKTERAAKDPNYTIPQMEKWILEDGIEDARETAKEWDEWVDEGEQLRRKEKKVFSDALRKANERKRR